MSDMVEFGFMMKYGDDLRTYRFRLPRVVEKDDEKQYPAGDLWRSVQLGEAHTLEFEGVEVLGEGDDEVTQQVAVKLDCRYLVSAWMK